MSLGSIFLPARNSKKFPKKLVVVAGKKYGCSASLKNAERLVIQTRHSDNESIEWQK
jgi:hypothetical protein